MKRGITAEGIPPALVVTGSARLDTMRTAVDSLAGRFFPFRLHPLDIKEVPRTVPEGFAFLVHQKGNPISYGSLARDLQCSHHTVKHWLAILENFYVTFSVPPTTEAPLVPSAVYRDDHCRAMVAWLCVAGVLLHPERLRKGFWYDEATILVAGGNVRLDRIGRRRSSGN